MLRFWVDNVCELVGKQNLPITHKLLLCAFHLFMQKMYMLLPHRHGRGGSQRGGNVLFLKLLTMDNP